MGEEEKPKSKGLSVDLAALSPMSWKSKKEGFDFPGQTQNTVIYYMIYAYWEWQRFMALLKKKCSNWD